MPPAFRTAIERALGARVSAATRVHGGDVAQAFRVDLDSGRRVFAKTHPSARPGFFSTEAAGLAWLREPGVVAVPEVLAVSDGDPAFLVLEWIDEGRAHAGTDAQFGHALAALHDAGAPCFGRTDRRTTGSLGLPNDPCDTWSEFYATRRLLPLARHVSERGVLDAATVSRLERLAASLDRFDDGDPPARLHGDLWAGNRLVDRAGTSWLIDPAAHGGHREFDLAMMRLFGGFGPDCFAAYAERHPLHPGWEDRVALHQLSPLLVHAIKFGGHYVAAAARAIDRY